MRLNLLIIFFFILVFLDKSKGFSDSFNSLDDESKNRIPLVLLESVDINKLKLEDEKDPLKSLAPRIGYPHDVEIDSEKNGMWIFDKNGNSSWYLRIKCPNAQSIALSFDKFYLPESGKLMIRESQSGKIKHIFNSNNNKGSSNDPLGFTTPHIGGDEIILEYEQTSQSVKEIISIFRIIQGYKAFQYSGLENSKIKFFGASGGCQVNVNCSEGANWQNEKTSVALIVADGMRIATGSLVNNTCEDGDLLFLTAEHILNVDGIGGLDYDAVSNPQLTHFTFYWGYEASGCSNPSNQPTIDFSYGALLLANSNTADFALFRLTDGPYVDIIPAYEAYFNGWDRSSTTSTTSGVSIHHPQSDIKKISTFSGAPTSGTSSGNGGNYWIIGWTNTANGFSVTEPGSSGAPLFNSSGKVMGQLLGSPSSSLCTNPGNQLAYFGKLSDSWTPNANIKRQLKHWLDKCNTGDIEINGGYLDNCEHTVNVNTFIPYQTVFYQADHTINANNFIGATANVELKSGEVIIMNDGFQVDAGAEFLAHIQPCAPVVITSSSKLGQEVVIIPSTFKRPDKLTIYPNPGNGIVNFKLESMDSEDILKIEIRSVEGELVYVHEKTQSSDELNVDLGHLHSGMYVVKIFSRSGIISEKFAKL